MPKVIPPFDYKNLTGKDPSSTALVKEFARHKSDVATIESDGKIKRTSGVAYKELALAMADSQQVVFRIKDTGDIFQVLINARVVPIKSQDDSKKAVIEIIDRLDAGRKAFMQSLARKKIEAPMPKGIKTAAANMIPALQERIAALKAEIEAVREERAAIEDERAKAGSNQNPIKNENAVVEPLAAENAVEEAVESNTQEPWDSKKEAEIFSDMLKAADGKKTSSAVNAFISQRLQGRIFKTKAGDCIINSISTGKLTGGSERKGSIKLKVIPHIPDILTQGDPGSEELLRENVSKTVQKTSIYAFVPLTHTISIDDLSIQATIKLGKRKDNPIMVYSLSASVVAMDSVQDEETHRVAYVRRDSEESPTLAGLPMGHESNLVHAFDSVNSDDDWNIEILHVWDKDGNELDPETLEPVNQIPVKKQDDQDDDDKVFGLSLHDFIRETRVIRQGEAQAVVVPKKAGGNLKAMESQVFPTALGDDELTDLRIKEHVFVKLHASQTKNPADVEALANEVEGIPVEQGEVAELPYTFTNATPSALSLFRIAAGDKSKRNAFVSAKAVEEALKPIAVHWDATDELPDEWSEETLDAVGLLGDDLGSGYIKGSIKDTKGAEIASVTIRGDGDVMFVASPGHAEEEQFDPEELEFGRWVSEASKGAGDMIDKIKSSVDFGRDRAPIEAYKQAFIGGYDVINDAMNAVDDDGDAAEQIAAVRSALKKADDGIKAAKKAAIDAGFDPYGEEVAPDEFKGLDEYGDKIYEARKLIDELSRKVVIEFAAKARAKLANVPKDAPIEDYAALVFRANGIDVADGSDMLDGFIRAIREKQANRLRGMLATGVNNKASKEVFERATGIKLGKTQKERGKQIDTYAGITPEQREAMNKQRDEDRAMSDSIKDVNNSWDALKTRLIRNTDGDVISAQKWIIDKFSDGYTDVGTFKQGVATVYGMTGSGKGHQFIKDKEFTAFMKAAKAYGGLDKALGMVGALLIHDAETVEEDDDDQDGEIARLFAPNASNK